MTNHGGGESGIEARARVLLVAFHTFTNNTRHRYTILQRAFERVERSLYLLVPYSLMTTKIIWRLLASLCIYYYVYRLNCPNGDWQVIIIYIMTSAVSQSRPWRRGKPVVEATMIRRKHWSSSLPPPSAHYSGSYFITKHFNYFN